MQGLIQSCSNNTLATDGSVRLVSLFDNEEASHRHLYLTFDIIIVGRVAIADAI